MDNDTKTEEKNAAGGNIEPACETESGPGGNPLGGSENKTGPEHSDAAEADDAAETNEEATERAQETEPKFEWKRGKPDLPNYQVLSIATVLTGAIEVLKLLVSMGAEAVNVVVLLLLEVVGWFMQSFKSDEMDKINAAVKKELQNENLLYDVPFRVTFNNQYGLVTRLLEAITGKKGIVLTKILMQPNFQSKDGQKGYILDCLAFGQDGSRFNMEPQLNPGEANDGRAAGHASRVLLDAQGEGLTSGKTPEVWVIFLTKATHMRTGKVLYEQTIGNLHHRPVIHFVYFSCGLASKLAKDKEAWNKPQEGIELDRWHELLRWGSDLMSESDNEIADEELRERKKYLMDNIQEGEWNIMGIELANWLEQERKEIEAAADARIAAADARIAAADARAAEADARVNEQVARALLKCGVSVKRVSQETGMDTVLLKQMKKSLIA